MTVDPDWVGVDSWVEPDAQAEDALMSKGRVFWRPRADNVYNLRFGWPWNDSNPVAFKEEAKHFGLVNDDGKGMVVECRDYARPGMCLVCAVILRLNSCKNPRAKKEAKELRQSVSYAHNVIVREEGATWKVWRAPMTVAKDLIRIRKELSDQGKMHYAHPTKGRDIRLNCTGTGFDRRYLMQPSPTESHVGIAEAPVDLDQLLRPNDITDEVIARAIDFQFGRMLED